MALTLSGKALAAGVMELSFQAKNRRLAPCRSVGESQSECHWSSAQRLIVFRQSLDALPATSPAAKAATTTPDPAATPDTSSRSQPTSLTTTCTNSLDSKKPSNPVAASVADYQDRLLVTACFTSGSYSAPFLRFGASTTVRNSEASVPDTLSSPHLASLRIEETKRPGVTGKVAKVSVGD